MAANEQNNSIRSSFEQKAGLDRVAESAEAQLKSVEACLAAIDSHLHPQAPEWTPSSDEEWRWTLRRLDALQRHDRVATALALCQGEFSAGAYSALCSADILTLAEGFAHAGNLTALGLLLQRHPYSLCPHILGLAGAAPETLPPRQLEPLLRQIVALREPPALPRPPGWAESGAMRAALESRGEKAAACATEHLVKAGAAWAPPTAQQVGAWARRRAAAVDRVTGQLQTAMELLEISRAALHYGPDSRPAAEAHRAAQQLMMIVKMAASRGEPAWRMDLGTFLSLDDVGRLQALLELLGSDELGQDIRMFIIPFMNQLGDGRSSGAAALMQALEREAASRLSWVVRFIQAEAQHPAAFETASDVARAACAAAYACPSAEAWSLQEALLSAAGKALESSKTAGDDPEEVRRLKQRMAQAQGHLTAARLLTKHGLFTSLAAVRDAAREDAAAMVRTLLARMARARTSERRWIDAWDDLRAAQAAGLQVLPLPEVEAEVCRALMGCGQLRQARKHLAALPKEAAEELVLDAARDAFYSEGSSNDAAVRRAQDILAVLPESAAAAEEASFIHAAARLRALGVDMPPLQLRQAPDKAALLRQAVHKAPPKALRNVDALVELSKALRTGLSKGQVLSLVAEAALEKGEPKVAEGVALQLAIERVSDGWEIAAQVALEEPCSSEGVRRSLIEYAMRFAAKEELVGELLGWQASDAGAAGDPELWTDPEGEELESGYLRPLVRALDECLERWKIEGNIPAGDDRLLVLSCLLALGADGQFHWADTLREQQSSLGAQPLRQAQIAGMSAAAITILTAAAAPTTSPPGAALFAKPPKDLLSAALHAEPQQLGTTPSLTRAESDVADEEATSSSSAYPVPAADIAALQSFAVDQGQQMIAAADAHRVAQLLPGQWTAGEWLKGGAAAQRSVVLQLAAVAGSAAEEAFRNGDTDFATEEGDAASPSRDSSHQQQQQQKSPTAGKKSPSASLAGAEHQAELQRTPSRKKSDSLASLSGLPIAAGAAGNGSRLDEALALARRCNVEEGEVRLAYATAVMTRDSGSLEPAQRDLSAAWPQLLESCPREAAAACLTEAYTKLDAARRDSLSWVLRLCGEGCDAVAAAKKGDEQGSSAAAAAAACNGLAEAVDSLDACCPDADAKVMVRPSVELLAAWLTQEGMAPELGDIEEDAAELLLLELAEHADAGNAFQLAYIMDALARQHAALVAAVCPEAAAPKSIYPATPSAVYVAALCRELAAMAVAESADDAERQRLAALFAGALPADATATAFFACMGGPLPTTLPDHLSNVLLAPDQCLAVLDAASPAFEAENLPPEALAAAAKLKSERTRLAVLLRVQTECELSETQIAGFQGLLHALLQLESKGGDSQLNQLVNFLSELLAAGTPARDAFCVSQACLPIIALSGAAAAVSIIEDAAGAAVAEALAAFEGTDSSSVLSAGDAIQNLYGVLRALEAPEAAPAAPPLQQAIDAARERFWGMLQRHASEHQTGDGASAAAAEAHLQVLQMLGLLGSTMWRGWSAPEGGSSAAAYSHAEALLHSRAASVLASAAWPGALHQAGVAASDFGSPETAGAAAMRVVELADSEERLSAVATMLSEVLGGAFLSSGKGEAESSCGVDHMHRAWAACVGGLLSRGALDAALAALDTGCGPTAASAGGLVTEEEASRLVEIANSAQGVVAGAAVALLTRYPRLCDAAWSRIQSLGSGEDVTGLPGAAALAVAALHRQRFAGLAARNPAALKHLCLALLQREEPAMWSSGETAMPPRSGLAAAAAAQLVHAGRYATAYWVAMEHAGTHPLLRVLDSGAAVLEKLLRAGAAAEAELTATELEPAAAAAVCVRNCAEAVLRGAPAAAAEALRQFCEEEERK